MNCVVASHNRIYRVLGTCHMSLSTWRKAIVEWDSKNCCKSAFYSFVAKWLKKISAFWDKNLFSIKMELLRSEIVIYVVQGKIRIDWRQIADLDQVEKRVISSWGRQLGSSHAKKWKIEQRLVNSCISYDLIQTRTEVIHVVFRIDSSCFSTWFRSWPTWLNQIEKRLEDGKLGLGRFLAWNKSHFQRDSSRWINPIFNSRWARIGRARVIRLHTSRLLTWTKTYVWV